MVAVIMIYELKFHGACYIVVDSDTKAKYFRVSIIHFIMYPMHLASSCQMLCGQSVNNIYHLENRYRTNAIVSVQQMKKQRYGQKLNDLTNITWLVNWRTQLEYGDLLHVVVIKHRDRKQLLMELLVSLIVLIIFFNFITFIF